LPRWRVEDREVIGEPPAPSNHPHVSQVTRDPEPQGLLLTRGSVEGRERNRSQCQSPQLVSVSRALRGTADPKSRPKSLVGPQDQILLLKHLTASGFPSRWRKRLDHFPEFLSTATRKRKCSVPHTIQTTFPRMSQKGPKKKKKTTHTHRATAQPPGIP
jgi:hypothetical protein